MHSEVKTEASTDNSDDDDDDDDEGGGYLHPSLRAKANTSTNKSNSAVSKSETTLPQLTPAQLESTAYGRLIKKLADQQPSLTNSPQRVATPTLRCIDHEC